MDNPVPIKDNYTAEEVRTILKSFMKNAYFIDFTAEFGIKGWSHFHDWVEKHVPLPLPQPLPLTTKKQ